jgi:hypothetical protein
VSYRVHGDSNYFNISHLENEKDSTQNSWFLVNAKKHLHLPKYSQIYFVLFDKLKRLKEAAI